MAEVKVKRAGTGGQLLGSLAAAALIVALAIWAVTARLGPTSIAGQEAAEEAEEAEEEKEGDSRGGRRRQGRDR
ncbi:MAG TPA: hypothetical protein VE891_04365 [Allosphingosinicella sp.]|nr:hypothetical protein [Allosphingosinicella sp.]